MSKTLFDELMAILELAQEHGEDVSEAMYHLMREFEFNY